MDFSVPDRPAIGAVIPGKSPATSMSYHEDGKRLFVVSENDSRLQVIDCLEGKIAHLALKAERERIHTVEATHHDHCVLVAGHGAASQPVGQRNAILYWSTHDNKLLRKFRGHTNQVTGIRMSPADDTFLSSSKDRTVRIWNAQQAGCLGECKLPVDTEGIPIAAYDSTGLVFAVAASMPYKQGSYLHLYDARNYTVGAFSEFKIPQTDLQNLIQAQLNTSPAGDWSKGDWVGVEFNKTGDEILVTTEQGVCLVLDGYEGTLKRAFKSKTEGPVVATFSSDGKTILAGNTDGSISCWDATSGNSVKTLTGHSGPVSCIASNPTYKQFASSCKDTALWIW